MMSFLVLKALFTWQYVAVTCDLAWSDTDQDAVGTAEQTRWSTTEPIGFELFHPKASLLRKDWSELANHVGDGSAESNTPACSYVRAVPSLMPARAAACFLSHPKSLVPQKSFSCKK